MKKRAIVVLLSLWCAFVIAAVAADQQDQFSHLMWFVSGNQQVDKQQAARIYVDACQWIEDRFDVDGRRIRPHIAVHVGVECPDPEITGACTSPATGALYLPKWDAGSPGAIAQATLATGLLQLMDRTEVKNVVRSLLANDARDFVDARIIAKEARK